MGYLDQKSLEGLNFRHLGKDVQISEYARLYQTEKMSISDFSRIDDFCVISGQVSIGRYVHLTPYVLVAGAEEGVVLEDFTTLAYGAKVFTRSDNYKGATLHNSTVPKDFTLVMKSPVIIKSYSIVGAGSIVLPGVTLSEGTSVGAMTLITRDTEPWTLYVGIPGKSAGKLSDEAKNLPRKFTE